MALAVFWCVSGLIAITVAYGCARHDDPLRLSRRAVACLRDRIEPDRYLVGLLIAFRKTHRIGLVAGIVVAVGYMLGSAVLTPALWIEPLGALVKTGPAILLMMVALAISDDR